MKIESRAWDFQNKKSTFEKCGTGKGKGHKKKERKGGLIWKSASDEVDLKTSFIKKVLSND